MKFYFYCLMVTVLLFALQSCSEDASFDTASAEKQEKVNEKDESLALSQLRKGNEKPLLDEDFILPENATLDDLNKIFDQCP